jgi:hypothetical protein
MTDDDDSVISRVYRKAEATPVVTAPILTEMGEAALSLLARDGAKTDGGANPGDGTWRLECETPEGVKFDVSLTGPDLPDTIPAESIHPTLIPAERPWVGEYRLIVCAPLIVFDIYWKSDAPLRIMTFCRGDWEFELAALAK